MADKKDIYKVDPIEVLPGSDPDVIGQHYANLHQHLNSQVGQDVNVEYTKQEQPNGRTKVQVVVKHK